MLIPKLDESITGVKAGSGMESGAMMDLGNPEEMEARMEMLDGLALAAVEEGDLGLRQLSSIPSLSRQVLASWNFLATCQVTMKQECFCP